MRERERGLTFGMKYEAKYKLSKNQYIAVLENALVIVTTDDNGKPIRWLIFKK